jgi:hypothetical protein
MLMKLTFSFKATSDQLENLDSSFGTPVLKKIHQSGATIELSNKLKKSISSTFS